MATILIVDDRPPNRELLVTLLGYVGHRLLEAADGEQGLAVARAERPDLIITDIVMPKMDGYEFARQIRADPLISNTQVIFYTSSYIVEETRSLAQACGVSLVIGKPVEPEIFLEIIGKALDNNEALSPIQPVPDEFHQEHMRILTDTLAKKVEDLESEIAERKRVEAQVRAQAKRLKILADASHEFSASVQDYQAALDQVARLVVDSLADMCQIRLLSDNQERLELAAIYSVDKELSETLSALESPAFDLANDPSLAARVIRSGKPALVSSITLEQLWASNPPEYKLVFERFPPHSFILVPLRVQGRSIGGLGLTRYRSEQPAFTEDDLSLAQDLADRAALAINSARLFQQVQNELAERKRIAAALSESESHYRQIIETAQEGVWAIDVENRTTLANQRLADIFGYTIEEMLGKAIFEFMDEEGQAIAMKSLENRRLGINEQLDFKYIRKDGAIIWAIIETSSLYDHEGNYIGALAMLTDITQRKQMEKALRESQERYRQIIETAQEGVWTIDTDNRTTLANQHLADILGYTIEEMLGKTIFEFMDEEGKAIAAKSLENRRLGINEQLDFKYIRKDGGIVWAIIETSSLYDQEGNYTGALAMMTDITERKQAEEKIRRQLQYLTALSEIDRAISSSFDLQFSLATVLMHVIAQLGVDAAEVLLFDSAFQGLEYAAGQGFHNREIEKAPIKLSKGHAARAVLNRSPVYIPDLKKQPEDSPRSALFEREGFVSYYAVPLFAKGELNGVLGIFNRSHLEPEKEWFDFLNTLAGQCAIAIDNATLFSGLQHSNIELALAYDATIAGWSHALDLRDKETEGHSRRVTEMSLRLAHAMGISKEEQVQIRRGALLHDIGKMGIPDGILLKPGVLTDEEWIVMKKHPSLAYEMLSPIAYLKPALDIPYCHHEKWDGTGYPRGLKGEQIPLAARIFAIVDVWDALRSDRPYRAAWSVEKVREHIRALSGTHFDPQVVTVFLESGVMRLA